MGSNSPMPSLVVCGPYVKPPTEEYLRSIRAFLLSCDHLRSVTQEIRMLHKTWDVIASHRKDIANQREGQKYIKALSDWIDHGESSTLREAKSGVVVLQLLIIIQIVQYFKYLEDTGTRHAELLRALQYSGGVQGNCAGLLSAFSIACGKDEAEVVQNATAAMRLAVAIGAYQQLGDDESIPGATTIVMRLNASGEGDEIVNRFPGCYVSSVTDPKTISVVGPVQTLRELSEFARDRGLLTQDMHIRGKVHNPENFDLAKELCKICDATSSLQLPGFEKLQLQLRSNRTGKPLKPCSLTHEVIYTILAARCEWYTLLQAVAQDMKSAGANAHTVLCFGLGDCTPVSAFLSAGISTKSLTKINVAQTILDTEPKRHKFNGDAIAVVGASCRLPGANNLDKLWQLVSDALSKCEPVRPDRVPPHWNQRIPEQNVSAGKQEYYGNFAEDIDKFDHKFFHIGYKEASYMDPQQRVLLELAYEALDSGGHLGRMSSELNDVGCFIGSSSHEYMENTSSHPPTAFTSTGTLRAFLCGRLSHHFGWNGPAEVIDTACSSSLVAVHRACRAILAGECSMAVAGGVSLITGTTNYLDLAKAGFLSPTGQCKPFDASADGYCRADGAGLVVLKRLEDARACGDQVLGVITAAATNQGGGSASITVPYLPAQTQLFKKVLTLSGMTADDVTYVEAHGTGTQVGDPIEMSSIRQVFGGSSRSCPLQLGSIKGNIGHCEGASGIAGLLKVLAMLKTKKLPPLASFKVLNSKIPPLGPDKMTIATSTAEWSAPIRAACINNYGAAGSNAAVLCCEYPPEKSNTRSAWEVRSQTAKPLPILISAHSRDSLLRYKESLATELASGHVNLSSLAFTLSEGREHHRFRFATLASDVAGLHQELMLSKEGLEIPPKKPVVMAFGGQNKQFVGLERFLYNTSPRLKHYIDSCDEILVRLGFSSIIPAVFSTTPISDVTVLQTATFAVQYACAKCWLDSGLQVQAVVGHSFGELTALVVSGVWTLTDGIKAIASRANLIATEWGAERGAMLAVHATRDVVLSLTHRAKRCEIACFNAKTSQVVVGPTDSIAQLEDILAMEDKYAGIRHQRLEVTHGFHSSFTEPLLSELSLVAGGIPIQTPEITIETCTYNACDGISPSHLVRHLRDPVYFEDAVRRIEDRLGPCLWMEAGLNSPIIPMVKRAVQEPSLHKFHALNITESEPGKCLPSATINLWLEGVEVTFWPFLTPKESGFSKILLPPYQFTRTAAWLENRGQMTTTSDPAKSQEAEPPKTVQLVNRLKAVGDQNVFNINTQSKRFREVVLGHRVRNKPLCPASMYMECVTMAAQLSGLDLSSGTLCFKDLRIELPLGADAGRRVTINLRAADSGISKWNFSVQSSQGDGSGATTHARGVLEVQSSRPNLGTFASVILKQASELQLGTMQERFMANRVYRLFSQVVNYSDFFRGIKSVVIGDNGGLAEVQLPSNQFGLEESTAVGICDTVSLDIFVQLSGLLLNTSEHCEPGSAFIATGIDHVTLSDDSNCFLGNSVWNVHTTFVVSGDARVTSDVFVLRPDGTLALTIMGVSFIKLSTKRLDKLLEGINQEAVGSGDQKAPRTTDEVSFPLHKPTVVESQLCAGDDVSSETSVPTPASSGIEETLKDLISSFTSAPTDMIDNTVLIVDLGLDSLAAAELAGDLSAQFGAEVSPSWLLTCSFGDLSRHLEPSKEVKPVPHASQPNGFSPSLGTTLSLSTSSTFRPDPPSPAHKLLGNSKRSKLEQMIAEFCGVDISEVRSHQGTLQDLGMDSLAITQLKSDLGPVPGLGMDSDDISLDSSLSDILSLCGGNSNTDFNALDNSLSVLTVDEKSNLIALDTPVSLDSQAESHHSRSAFSSLQSAEHELPSKAQGYGFGPSSKEAFRRQDSITVAFILEAFKELGANLWELQAGTEIPSLTTLPNYSRALERYHHILQKHGLIEFNGSTYLRTPLPCPLEQGISLVDSFKKEFPAYKYEAELLATTGPRLADCLTGKQSGPSLLFSRKEARSALEGFYAQSPMLATSTGLLVDVISRILAENGGATTRIIEVGAGFCSTIKQLAPIIKSCGHRVEYTVTDISPTLVAQASKALGVHKFVKFDTFNLEKSPTPHLTDRFDIVIGTNCVHATTDRVAALRNIRKLLNSRGCVLLSEVCEIMDWYDVVFGLFDGWWISNDRSYPLQPLDCWKRSLRAAGFKSLSHSQLAQPFLNIQHLILASVESLDILERDEPPAHSRVETVIYKEAQGVYIPADIYIPRDKPQTAMSLAMMIHGGGHITLSRKAVRPAQTEFLLQNGVLPVSFDYRLCPEVNLIDGPIADIRDGYRWMQTELPSIVKRFSIVVDPTKIAVIGWSTGGHLAMTTAWTTKGLGIEPPRSILSFYSPLDFESGGKVLLSHSSQHSPVVAVRPRPNQEHTVDFYPELDTPRLQKDKHSQTSLTTAIKSLTKTPITSHNGNEASPLGSGSSYGNVNPPGNPRSELLMSLFRDGHGLSLLLNDIAGTIDGDGDPSELLLRRPPQEQITLINPIAHVRGGDYTTPTYVIYGTKDTIVPFKTAVDFLHALRKRNVSCGMLVVPDAAHLHDLTLKPGTMEWEAGVAPGYAFLLDSFK